ncbi:hypothetical protein PC128_g19315 [Phytophthora cactorum]|nr:hypothetical protein PC122_g15428 [Phytophthora cactorum]KAG3168821.1 hypothetical protein PC128_g19315 [Phytophthora cactorum]
MTPLVFEPYPNEPNETTTEARRDKIASELWCDYLVVLPGGGHRKSAKRISQTPEFGRLDDLLVSRSRNQK